MAPQYKVIYFDSVGVGEPIRYLLSYGGIEFEDVRVKREQWPEMKPNTPFGQLPLIEIDGKRGHQTSAICRFLGRKVGLSGDDDWQSAKIDSAVDTVNDLRQSMIDFFHADEATKEKMKDTLENVTKPFYLTRLDAQVKENGGYLVDSKLTWADVHFAAVVDAFNRFTKIDMVAAYPNLKGLVNKVWEIPNIKTWREKTH